MWVIHQSVIPQRLSELLPANVAWLKIECYMFFIDLPGNGILSPQIIKGVLLVTDNRVLNGPLGRTLRFFARTAL